MLSTRFLVVCGFALLVVATAYPFPERAVITPSITEEDISFPWMSISPFSLFAPLWKLIPSFADIGPRIYNDEDKLQIVVNVKDYIKEDLKVTVKGLLIFVQGSQEANQNNRDVFATQFYHTYSLPSNSSSSLVTAKLTADGFLVVTAPISEDLESSEIIDRVVPIVETGAPYRRELPPVKPLNDAEPTEVVKTTEAPATTQVSTTTTTTTQAPTTTTTKEPTTPQTSTTTQEPTTPQTSTTTEITTTSQSSTTTSAPAETESTTTPAPITNPQPTNTQAPTTSVSPVTVVDEEEKDIQMTPSEQEDVTEKDNVIPHGNEVTL